MGHRVVERAACIAVGCVLLCRIASAGRVKTHFARKTCLRDFGPPIFSTTHRYRPLVDWGRFCWGREGFGIQNTWDTYYLGMVEKELEMALASIKRLQTDLEADKDLELFRVEQGDSPVVVSDIDRLLEETLNHVLEDEEGLEGNFLGEELDDMIRK